MGANRTLATPEAYPAAFLAAIRNGGAVIYAHDLLWTTGSAAKRFRLCVALLRSLPHHALHEAAKARWHVEASPTTRALVIRVEQPVYSVASVAAPIITRALTIGVNPNGTPPEAAS